MVLKILLKSWRYILLSIAILAHVVLIMVVQISTSQKEKRKDNTIFKVVDVTEFIEPPKEKVIKKTPPPPPPPKKVDPVKQVEVAPQDDIVEDVVLTEKEVLEDVPSEDSIEINYLPQHKISNAPGLPTKEILKKAVELYPKLANKQRIEGVVILELFIDQLGNIRDIQVLKDPGHGFADAALEAMNGVKCEPAMANGTPVAVRFRYPVRFKLK